MFNHSLAKRGEKEEVTSLTLATSKQDFKNVLHVVRGTPSDEAATGRFMASANVGVLWLDDPSGDGKGGKGGPSSCTLSLNKGDAMCDEAWLSSPLVWSILLAT